MLDIEKLEKNNAEDISNLQMLVAYAADMLLHGTFSQRRPDIPRRRCGYCGRRPRLVRGKLERCCNAAYAKTQRAWDEETGFHQVECAERVSNNFFSKHFLRRLRHKRHGQGKMFHIRQILWRFRHDAEYLNAAVAEIQARWPLVKAPDASGLPAFAERWYAYLVKQESRRLRRQADISRRINRGLEKRGARA